MKARPDGPFRAWLSGQPEDRQSPWKGEFARPRMLLRAMKPEEVRPLIREAEAQARSGRWVMMVLGYEAAPALDAAFAARRRRRGMPLGWAAVFDGPRKSSNPRNARAETMAEPRWRPEMNYREYAAAVEKIQEYIRAGDIYQANFTFPLRARFQGDARAWFEKLARRQPRGFHAYIEADEWRFLSFSPELFFERRGGWLRTRPMKGTAARGRWAEEDMAQAERLRGSAKEQAENLMITDLLRNDMGRVARAGTVRTGPLFAVEQHPTLWQMTSGVEARLRPETTLEDCLAALFPCGSVTGAPKIRALQILRERERGPRGLYTGAIGIVRPGGDCAFSVAIRTIELHAGTGGAIYGVGSGITHDAEAASEYRECLLKAEVLRSASAAADFHLFETMRLRRGKVLLWPEHRARLRASARYFGWAWPAAKVDAAMAQLRRRYRRGDWRVRLELHPEGQATATAQAMTDEPRRIWKVAWDTEPVDANEPGLFHKTSRRERYERARARRPGHDDVLLWNERGEATESTLANLVAEFEDGRFTPPLECGLLPGTLRARLLAQGRIRERGLRKTELERARKLYLINSVRGWIEAEIKE